MEVTAHYDQKGDIIVIHRVPEKEMEKWSWLTHETATILSDAKCLKFFIGEIEIKLFT